MKCIYCQSTNITKNIMVTQAHEAGRICLSYKASVFYGTEPLVADLCNDCGSITRLFVKNNKRQWNHDKKASQFQYF